MMSCTEAGQLFYGYLDKELSPEDIQKVEEHIHACQKCFGHLEFDKAFQTFLKKQGSKIQLSNVTKKLIRERLQDES